MAESIAANPQIAALQRQVAAAGAAGTAQAINPAEYMDAMKSMMNVRARSEEQASGGGEGGNGGAEPPPGFSSPGLSPTFSLPCSCSFSARCAQNPSFVQMAQKLGSKMMADPSMALRQLYFSLRRLPPGARADLIALAIGRSPTQREWVRVL